MSNQKRASFYESPVKDRIRKEITTLLYKATNNKKVLTLGGEFLNDAKKFVSQNTAVISVERDREVWEKQKKEVANYPIFCLLGHLEKLMTDSYFINSVEFDMIYLDYLGPYTLSKEKTIAHILETNVLKKGGHLCVTLELSREDETLFKGSTLYDITCGGDMNDYWIDRVGVLERGIQDVAAEYNKTLKVIKCEKYCNTESIWEVYLHGELIDTKFFFKKVEEQDVYNALIAEGLNPNIKVSKVGYTGDPKAPEMLILIYKLM